MPLITLICSFDAYVWSFLENHPIQNSWKKISQVPGKYDVTFDYLFDEKV